MQGSGAFGVPSHMAQARPGFGTLCCSRLTTSTGSGGLGPALPLRLLAVVDVEDVDAIVGAALAPLARSQLLCAPLACRQLLRALLACSQFLGASLARSQLERECFTSTSGESQDSTLQ